MWINSLTNIDETLTAHQRLWNFARFVIARLRLPRLSVCGLTRYLVSSRVSPRITLPNDIIINRRTFLARIRNVRSESGRGGFTRGINYANVVHVESLPDAGGNTPDSSHCRARNRACLINARIPIEWIRISRDQVERAAAVSVSNPETILLTRSRARRSAELSARACVTHAIRIASYPGKFNFQLRFSKFRPNERECPWYILIY